MRLNKTNTQSSVINRVVNLDGMVDADLVHRAGTSLTRRFLEERAYHRGPGSGTGRCPASSCQCELVRQPLSGMSKATSPMDLLPGPIWAALVIARATA